MDLLQTRVWIAPHLQGCCDCAGGPRLAQFTSLQFKRAKEQESWACQPPAECAQLLVYTF